MITGIGLDLCAVDRIARLSPAVLERLFTPDERTHAGKRTESLAGIFAAKEALTKASAVGLMTVLREAEIQYDDTGAPCITLSDNLAKRLGAVRFFVSITHDAGFAAAVVVAERI